MKKSFKYLLFVTLIVFMTACPFEAPFPIDQPSVRYSTSMLGRWIAENELESETPSYYEISEIDSYSFTVEEYTYESEEENYSIDEYSAHLSVVGDYKFLNVYDNDMETWYFYRMDWDDPDQFSLFAVTDYIDEEFDSSEEMKIYFEKYADLSFFYQSADTYLRAE